KYGDSDGDGLSDGDEANTYSSDPLNPDSDSDGLGDGSEVATYGTDPIDPDSDSDGLIDGDEIQIYGTNPLLPDTDGDEVYDGQEVLLYLTDPLNREDFPSELDNVTLGYQLDHLLRERDSGTGQLIEVEQVCTISRVTPRESPGYRVEVWLHEDGQTTLDYSSPVDDPSTFSFSTEGLQDGKYSIKVIDRWGFEAVLEEITLDTITVNRLTSTGMISPTQGGELAVEDANDPGNVYNGTTIQYPPAVGGSEFELSFSVVETGAPFLAASEQVGPVFKLYAENASGDPVNFDDPIIVTLPQELVDQYAGSQVGLVHFMEETGEWDWIPIDILDNTVTIHSLSLFAMAVPSTFGPVAIDGGTETAAYHMISCPGHALTRNIRTALEETLGTYDDTLWRLFAWDDTVSDYVEVTDDNVHRFDDEFGAVPGQAYWLITREGVNLAFTGLSHDDRGGATFHRVLYPGWNMISHPWPGNCDLGTHRIEVSLDGVTYHSIDDSNNTLTEKMLWTFKGPDGVEGDWYRELGLNNEAMQPYQGYWLKNLLATPVYLRMVKRTTPLTQIPAVPDRLRMLAMNWVQKGISATASTCYAQVAGVKQPPPPPGAAGASDESIGVSPTVAFSGSGGGGCFVATAAYGSPRARQVRVLRQFRDRVLLSNEIGKSLVKLYYWSSPPVAHWIGRYEPARAAVRVALVPVVGFCWLWLNTGTVVHLLIFFVVGTTTVGLGMLGWRRRRFGR
ncbi:MAG: hypothetical protein JSU72_13850, partial [Deltaproteobacteria bacterium]